jgi:Zn-finger nucleic acid-binding protein
VEETHPWDYPDTALITLCASCHLELHKRTKVKVFKDKSLSVEMPYDSCNRCHGAGSFPQFKHVENGTCFKCRGARFMRSKVVSFTF